MTTLIGRNNKPGHELLKSLADETRLAIIRQLLDGPRSVQELNTLLGVEQTLFSHHLKILRQTGLVVSKRSGKRVIYQLAAGVRSLSQQKTPALDLGCCKLEF
ncbi:MAG: metalloregulator ArsR/SmtB family transcription factor [Thermodesulfobacteriota bacterium]